MREQSDDPIGAVTVTVRYWAGLLEFALVLWVGAATLLSVGSHLFGHWFYAHTPSQQIVKIDIGPHTRQIVGAFPFRGSLWVGVRHRRISETVRERTICVLV